MKYKLFIALIVVVMLINATPVVRAQKQPGSPLIIRSGDVLYTWQQPDGQLRRLTLAGNRPGSLALSPDGQWLLYEVVPPAVSAQMDATHEEVNDGTPFDLHLLNVATKRDTAVYKQTVTAQRVQAGGPFAYLIFPQWSPDGKQLAWFSYMTPDPTGGDSVFVFRANIYDVATRQTTSFGTNVKSNELEYTLPSAWTGTVLATVVSQSQIARFAPDGRELGRTNVGAKIDSLIAVTQKDQEYIGAIDANRVLSLVDPATGQMQTAEGGPEQYSLAAPAQSLSFFANERPDFVLKWRVVQPDGKTVPLDFDPLAISPAGDQIAYVSNDAAYVWKDGQATPIKGTGDKGIKVTDLVWSALGWRVQPAAVNGLATMSAATLAKLPDAPVLILVKGNLYAWTKNDKQPRPLTTRGNVSAATVSPDGESAIYRAQPKPFGGKAFASFREIWLLDLASGQSTAIEGVPAAGQDVVRLSPSWSPDGTQIAWMELTWPGQDHRLVVYDMNSHTAKVVVSGLPYPTDIFSTWMMWGKSGIAVVWRAPGGSEVRVYSPTGALVVKAPLDKGIYIDYPMWITAGGKDFVGVLSLENPNGFQLIDPQTGQKKRSEDEIELFNPAQGISVFYANTPTNSLDNWRVALPDGTIDPIHVIGGLDALPALSPGGMEVAYSIYGRAFIYRDGEVLAIPLTGKEESGATPDVTWGPVHYRLRQAAPVVTQTS